MNDSFSKLGVNRFYKYKEVVKDKKTVEFGWEDCNSFELNQSTMISRDSNGLGSAVILSDCEKYFTSLTGTGSSSFLGRWKYAAKELEKYWYEKNPKSEKDSHEFILKLANLIQNKESFSHKFLDRQLTFEVVDAENESSGSQERDKD